MPNKKTSVEPNRRQIDCRPALMTNRLELVGMRNGDYLKLKAMKLIRHKECCSIECTAELVCVCVHVTGSFEAITNYKVLEPELLHMMRAGK